MNAYTKNFLKDGIELSYASNGDVEVLVSPGWGAGWSTWNDDGLSIAVDKRIVDFFKEHGQTCPEDKVKEFCESLGYRVYAGGWDQIVIVTVPEGVKFHITVYDGYEELEIVGEDYFYEF